MDRIRMKMTSLLTVAAAVLGAGAACAQGHDPSAAARARVRQLRESPDGRAGQLAEKHAWLQRLVGRFHAESTDWSVQGSGTQGSLASRRTIPMQGRAECVIVAAEPDTGTSCLFDLRTPQGESSATAFRAFRVTLPLGTPDGADPAARGSLYMGMIQGTTMTWASLEGDTATFRMECPDKTSGLRTFYGNCQMQVRIKARPDGSSVQVSIESGAFRSTLIELNRARPRNADEGAGLRSGQ